MEEPAKVRIGERQWKEHALWLFAHFCLFGLASGARLCWVLSRVLLSSLSAAYSTIILSTGKVRYFNLPHRLSRLVTGRYAGYPIAARLVGE